MEQSAAAACGNEDESTWLHSSMTCSLGAGLSLWGRSRAADSTAFIVPELGLALDAGAIISSAKPHTVLVTHSHADHCFRLTHLWSRDKVPDIYVPEESLKFVLKYVDTCVELSSCSDTFEMQPNCKVIGVNSGELISLRKDKSILIEVFEMTHSVPCRGFGVSRIKKKLKTEFKSLAGKEIADLRRRGVEVMEETRYPLFVFCGDTTSRVFEISPSILAYPVS